LTFDPGRTFTVGGMERYTISQVARRTGFSTSTLRFYEQQGLVRPDRTASGYRSYGDHHLELLGFIARAKGYGLSLEEITELLSLLELDRCAPVHDRLRLLVGDKLRETEDRVQELQAFGTELRRVASILDAPAPEGPCDDGCGCIADPAVDVPPIACTLGPDEAEGRVAEWNAVVARATDRTATAGGMRLRFPRTVDVAELARLAAAEQGCCRFFTFSITVADDAVVLDIAAPADAMPILDELVGVGQ
jgi:DNA-binding transcriptional MerR regulator